QAVTLLNVVLPLLRFHGFRAGLQDIDFAVNAVATPLDVHGTPVVVLDNAGITGQLNNFFVAERIAISLGNGDIDRAYGMPGAAVGVELHFDQLGANAAADDGVMAGSQCRLEYVELVGVYRALNDCFAQAIRGSDEDDIAKAGFGVQREHDAGTALVGAHHALHTCRQRDIGIGIAFVNAVRNGAVVIQRGKYQVNFFEDFVDANHVQIGFLLAGKRRVGKVFGGGR